MKRKLKVAIVAAVMALTMIPAAAFATGDVCEGGNSCTHEAAIDGEHYATLEAAVKAVPANGTATITLLRDVIVTNADDSNRDDAYEREYNKGAIWVDNGKKITLDLAGYEVKFDVTKEKPLNVRVKNGSLTIKGPGTMYEAHGHEYLAPVIMYGSNDEGQKGQEYSKVIVGENVTLKGRSGLFINPNNLDGNGNNYGISAVVYGTLENTGNAFQDTPGYAFYVNGTIEKDNGSVNLIFDGATINAGKGDLGMYMAGYAETTIRNSTINADKEGQTGIELRAGKMTITDSVVTSGKGTVTCNPNGNGTTTENVAVAVIQHTTANPVELTISNSNISGSAALYQENIQNTGAVDKIKIDVQSGTFTGDIESQNVKNFITSGEFSKNVDATYVSDAVQAKATYTDNGNVSYLIGKPAIDNKLAAATSGTVTITQADQDVEFVTPAEGVTIVNKTDNIIVVVDGDKRVEVEKDSSYVTPAADPEEKPSTDKTPDTGDDSSMMLMVALMAMAAAAGATAFVRRRSN